MSIANDEQNQLAELVKKFFSNNRPKSLNMEKKARALKVLQWHFLKEEK